MTATWSRAPVHAVFEAVTVTFNVRGVIAQLRERGAESVILGCTEIRLFVQFSDRLVPLFDTTILQADVAVDLAIAGA